MPTNPAFESRLVTAIAYEAGFADLWYFYRRFGQRQAARHQSEGAEVAELAAKDIS